jgi:hypothetical protein
MDTETLLELVPHYVAMVILVYLVLAVVRLVAGPVGFVVELVVIAAVVVAYRPLVRYVGLEPGIWEE